MQITFSIKHYRFGSLLLSGFVWLLIAVGNATAADIEQKNRFYSETKHGWFWYEDPPPEQEVQESTPDLPVKPPERVPSLDNISIDELWNMHPDDFQELLNGLQKRAVQYPTEDNILQYRVIQDIARRKALAYTNASMYVTQKYSNLFNVNQVYPTAGPGITARVQMQQDEITHTIGQANQEHALLFFVSPGCGYCEKQAQILAYFVDKYGWQIKTVDISRQRNAATRFNITITPTLLLIKRGQEKYMTVTTGVIALTELERKLYRAIRYLQGSTQGDNFLMYDFQKGTAFDPTSILKKGKQPWIRKN
ncbi:MAG: conjugal transfer protein TraF [Thermodesulfobacteriota bacterium]|nr:conjugal transfer protein TraF [Thermodesulfobacteriota bacterium]